MDRVQLSARVIRLAVTGVAGVAFALAIGVHPAQARACIAQVEVHDRAQGQVLPMHRKFGRRWIAGEPGHEYDLRIRNCTDVRVLAVISVDGINVITGQSASPSQSGYVLEPGENLTVEGWRKSMDRTAAFVFTDPADSYASRTGRPNDLGVIGVAFFRERRPKVVAQERERAEAPSAPSSRAEPAADAAAKHAESSGILRSATLGTGHGRSEHSPAQWTSFARASDDPDEVFTVRYETRAALVAMGVLPRERLPARDPEPFPATLGFVPDPYMPGIVGVAPALHTAERMQARDAADDQTDEALMLAWQAGDARAFDRLYHRHRGGVFRYLLRHCGHRATAEELYQDVWLKLIAARASFDAGARFTAWLYSVARNRMIDHWRASRAARHVSLDDDGHALGELLEDPSPIADPQGTASALQESGLLVAALEALPAAQRDAFLLHVEGGLAVAEIATLTAAPAETVKSRLRYAYRRLRESLGDPA